MYNTVHNKICYLTKKIATRIWTTFYSKFFFFMRKCEENFILIRLVYNKPQFTGSPNQISGFSQRQFTFQKLLRAIRKPYYALDIYRRGKYLAQHKKKVISESDQLPYL